MVAQIIGNYLVERGIMTRGQMLVLHKERKKLRAKLGLVAIAEGFMSPFEVKEIYEEIESHHDEPADCAFADIAKERSYLNDGQVRMLAHKQNDSFLCFVQALEKQGIIDFERLNEILHEFPLTENEFQLDDLKSNDINRIVPLFIPPEANDYIEAACCAVRFLEQRVDSNIYPLKAYLASEFIASNGVFQVAKGEREYAYGLAVNNMEMAIIATCYMRERYDGLDEEILDVISEIVSNISSSYANELSQDGIVVDLMPPQPYLELQKIKSEKMLVIELSVKYEICYLLVCLSASIEVH